jgi:hypothetical protein
MRARPAILIAAAAASIITAASVVADPPWPVAGAESAADTIRDPKSQGYRVGINWVFGYTNTSLDRCSVTAIHNPDGLPGDAAEPTTVYIDVSCPDHHDW